MLPEKVSRMLQDLIALKDAKSNAAVCGAKPYPESHFSVLCASAFSDGDAARAALN
jgi:hypothetical protein